MDLEKMVRDILFIPNPETKKVKLKSGIHFLSSNGNIIASDDLKKTIALAVYGHPIAVHNNIDHQEAEQIADVVLFAIEEYQKYHDCISKLQPQEPK